MSLAVSLEATCVFVKLMRGIGLPSDTDFEI
jgi:hypothetical protein